MDWKELGSTLAKVGLPILGNAIVPGGGTIVTLVASALGLTGNATPDAIATAVNTNPDNIIKLKELQDRHEEFLVKASYDAETAQIQAVNATLQADARGDSWLQKNHHALESLATTFSITAIYFLLPIMKIPVPAVPEAAFLMLGGILGVTAWKHGVVNNTIAQGNNSSSQ